MEAGGSYWILSVNASHTPDDSKVHIADHIATPTSLTRVVTLDLLIWICQLVSLEVTYITAHANNIPHSPSFPYPDYLLPPTYSSDTKAESGIDDNETTAEDDVDSGLKRRRRKGFESAFEELDGEMDALWLNEDDGPGGRPRGKFFVIIEHEYADS